jgi:integrase
MSASLRRWAADYLALRARVGYRTDDHRRLLASFLGYLDEQHSSTIRVCDALAWATQPDQSTSGWRAHRLAAVRCFAAHIHASEPDTADLIPAGLLPARRNRHAPYLYTDTQITMLILGAQQLVPTVWGQTMATFIGLMAATGMRTSEAVGLDTTSLDGRSGTIRVLGKGGAYRLLPVHPSTVTALSDYIRISRELVGAPPTGSLFVTQQGTRPSANRVQQAFRKVADGCRLPIPPGRRAPRLHDLRHTFAVNTLLDAHRAGVDVDARIALLVTYLGHVTPANTYWYLTASPELLALVNDLVQTHQQGRLP